MKKDRYINFYTIQPIFLTKSHLNELERHWRKTIVAHDPQLWLLVSCDTSDVPSDFSYL